MSYSYAQAVNTLKSRYRDPNFVAAVLENYPFLAQVNRFTGMTGDDYPLIVRYQDLQTWSSDFSTAQAAAAANAPGFAKFKVQPVESFAIGRILGDMLDRSSGSEGAFVSAQEATLSSLLNDSYQKLEFALFRDGWGSIGTISAIGTNTITLDQTSDIAGVEATGSHQFAQNLTTGVLRAAGASLVVSGVDRENGIITYSTNTSTISGLSVGDTVFLAGCRQDVSNPVPQLIPGLAAWGPATLPVLGSDSFYGQDRGVDSRLSMTIHDATGGQPLDEALVQALAKVAQQGGKPSEVWVNHINFGELSVLLGSRVRQIPQMNTEGTMGFSSLVLAGPRGDCKIMASHMCQGNRMWILDPETIEFASYKEAPHIIADYGNQLIPLSDDDGIEIRAKTHGALIVKKPAHNGVVLLPSAA